ncbi:MAG: VWA domain-containing protein [Butyricimonas faecihominis]
MDFSNKLPLLKSSLKLLVKQLRPQDRVAIVLTQTKQEVLTSTRGSNKAQILAAIDGLYASGGTAGGDGIQRAYPVAENNLLKGEIIALS